MTEIEKLYKIFLEYPNISTDTRNIEKDCLFFALKGENFDANGFAKEAIEKGAAWAVVSDPNLEENDRFFRVDDTLKALQELASYHRSKLDIPILGITGSNGKTTTKELLHAALNDKYTVLATPGNFNNHIGVPLTLLGINASHDFAIIEMGANHIGEIEFLSNIADPDYGIITNIGKAHLKGFGSYEGVKKAKTELYRYIRNKKGMLFVNAEDEFLMKSSKDIKRVLYGLGSDIVADQTMNSVGQIKININGKTIQTKLFGDYNFLNLLCAWCVASYFGVEEDGLIKGLESYSPKNNRSQIVEGESNTIIMDAYNANPSSMKLAVSSFSKIDAKNKVLILGDMLELGDEEAKEHQDLVTLANDLGFTNVYLVGDIFSGEERIYPTFVNVSDLMNEFDQKPIKEAHILIKGSRGIKLEKVLDQLV